MTATPSSAPRAASGRRARISAVNAGSPSPGEPPAVSELEVVGVNSRSPPSPIGGEIAAKHRELSNCENITVES